MDGSGEVTWLIHPCQAVLRLKWWFGFELPFFDLGLAHKSSKYIWNASRILANKQLSYSYIQNSIFLESNDIKDSQIIDTSDEKVNKMICHPPLK